MTWKRWLFTAASFAAVIGISTYFILHWWRAGSSVGLPARAHVWAIAAVLTEIVTRALKITWSGKSLGIDLSFMTAMRTTLAGDFGGSVTPARSGSEPARFMVLAETGMPTPSALVILYAELFLEMLSLAAVVLVVAFVFRDSGKIVSALVGLVVVYTAVIMGVALGAMLLAKRGHRDEPPSWAKYVFINRARWHVIERWFAKVRESVERVKGVNLKWATASFLASFVHVAMRLCVLPALVLGAGVKAALAPLALWPLALLYGAAVVPAPGGGGAVEFTFSTMLSKTIGPEYFAAALLWWRFYTFYIYIGLGALAAGRTVMRALRKTEELEEELEHGEE